MQICAVHKSGGKLKTEVFSAQERLGTLRKLILAELCHEGENFLPHRSMIQLLPEGTNTANFYFEKRKTFQDEAQDEVHLFQLVIRIYNSKQTNFRSAAASNIALLKIEQEMDNCYSLIVKKNGLILVVLQKELFQAAPLITQSKVVPGDYLEMNLRRNEAIIDRLSINCGVKKSA